jgi:hypothetical protein
MLSTLTPGEPPPLNRASQLVVAVEIVDFRCLESVMGSRFVVGQTYPKQRALLEAPLQHGYTLDNSIAPGLPSGAAAGHQRAVGVISASHRLSQPFLPSRCRNAGMFSSRSSQT